jgi:hypothetical protein
MLNNSVSGDRLPEPAIVAPVHSDNLEPAIQDALSALANVEARYQHEREQLERRSGPDGMKARWQLELEERHRKERELLVHHLAELHQHTMTLTMFRQLRLID